MMNGDNKRIMDNARDVLVGVIPDPKGQVEQITAALVYRYLDELDQKSVAAGGKRSFFTGKDAKYSWQKLLSTSILGDQRLTLYRDAMESMADNNKLPQVFCDMLRGMHSPFRDARVLMLFLNEINQLDCEHTEDLGDAYEHLLSIMGTQGNAGQFRTPRHIIDFIVDVMRPQIGERVLDPACGSAGFLVSAYNFIMRQNTGKKHGDKLTQSQKQKLPKNIEGRDIDPGMTRLALVNLYLHGIKEPQVREYDSLSDDSLWEERHDVILANPPFMTPRGGIQPHRKFSINANRAEVLFVDYIAEHISRTGRAGIVVPEGIVFQEKNAYKELRKLLVNEWGLFAVVSLPAGIFQPYSGVKTSILFLDKTKRSNKNILFVKVQNDGFDLGARRASIDKNDLPAALQIINSYEGEKKINNSLALSVVKTKIAEEGNFNLTTNIYRETRNYKNVKWGMVNLGDVCEILDRLRKPITKSNRINGDYPYYGATGIVDWVDDFIFNEKLVLVGEDGAKFGRYEETAFIADGKYWVNNHVHVLRPIENIVMHEWLVYYLTNIDLMPWVTGLTVPKLNQSKLRSIPIPIPPLEQQQRIVAEIDGYAKVRDGAKAVVNNWKPTINIDLDWEKITLGDVCEIQSGLWKGKKEPFIKATVVRNTNFRVDGYLNYDNVAVLDVEEKQFKSRQLIFGDIILEKSGGGDNTPVGRVGLFERKDGNYSLSNFTAYIRVKDNKRIFYRYLHYFLYSFYINGGTESMQRYSTAIRNLQLPQYKSIVVLLPSLEQQKRIVAEIEAERQLVNASRMLVDKMDAKIAATIGRIWEK